MRDARARENLYQKFKETQNLIMWDVYIWEAHPGSPAPKPKTFEQRIKNYERYKNDKNMTMPALIDSIKDQWSRSWWASRPTTMYMIGVDGKLFEVFNFMLGGGYYPRIETALKKAIAQIIPTFTIDLKSQNSLNNIELVKTPTSFRLYLPYTGNNRIIINDAKGRQMTMFITDESKQWYTIPNPASSGMHIMTIKTPRKTISKPLMLVK